MTNRQTVESLKSKGQYAEAGALAYALDIRGDDARAMDRGYGCHYGMRSDRAASIAAFVEGFDNAARAARIEAAKPAAPRYSATVATFEFDTRAHDKAILRTPKHDRSIYRFGIYAVATLTNGKAYRLNIYEARNGSIDVVVYGKGGRTIPENQLIGLRNVAVAVYRDTFHQASGLRTREESPHARHKGEPSGRVIETETGFGLEWIEPAAPVETESRYPVDKPGKIDAIRYAFLLSGAGARTTHGNVTLQVQGDEFVLSAPDKAPHRLAIEHTSAARLDSHWQAYVAANAGERRDPCGNVIKPSDPDYSEAVAAPAASLVDVLATLKKAESFIAGFEGDEMQEGVDSLLAELRAAIEPAPGATETESDDLATADEIAEARAAYADDYCQIDEGAKVSRADNGAWVAAWVWVGDDSADSEPNA